MDDGNFGVTVFLVLIVAFVVYIAAAAMRDRKKRLAGPDEEEPTLPERVLAASGPLYCYSCMTKLSGGETVCPACGRPAAVREKPGHLPVGVVLADRYTIGLSVAESPGCISYLAADNYLETRHLIREFFPGEYAARGADGAEVTVSPGAEQRFAAGRKQFARETRLQCRLNGFSSAAGATDLFFTNGTAYAVTEWTDAQPLTVFLSERKTLSPEYTLALFAPAILQLAQEQSMGLLRFNLTPESFSVGNGALKLEGFGTPGGSLPAFPKPGFAPEELYRKSGSPGAWTDVYSLCAVMYWCMTGVAPDAASDRVYKDELRAPSSMGAYLSAVPETGLMKGLSVYQEDRPADCAALFRALFAGNASSEEPWFFRPIIDPLADDPPDGKGDPVREPEDHEI